MLSFARLPGRNLRAHPARTGALVVIAVLMAMATFGGAILVDGIRHGLDTVQERFGADILVTPSDADNEFNAQSVLVSAQPGYFYMDVHKNDEVGAVEGVKEHSAQVFLASARSSCCSGRYQVVAFDPDTDFAIQPWIADTSGNVTLGAMDVIVGANVTIPVGGGFRIYGRDLHIVGQFDPTGSTLDNAVYGNAQTGRALIQASVDKGLNKYMDVDPAKVISSVLVTVEDGEDVERVAQRIRENVDGVSVATAKNMVRGIAQTLDDTSVSVGVFMVLVWVIGAGMTLLVFAALINERAREFALLKTLGVNRGRVVQLIVSEAVIVNLMGGLIGIVLAGGILAAFRLLVSSVLGVSFIFPSAPTLAGLALGSLATVLSAAVIAGGVGVWRVHGMDAALVVKEGE